MGFNQSAILTFFNNPSDALWAHLGAGLALLLLVILTGHQLMRSKRDPRTRQVLTGASILFLLQVFLGASTFFTPDSMMVKNTIIHVATGLTVVWITWTFLESKRPILHTGIALLATFAIIFFAAGFLLILWLQPARLPLEVIFANMLWLMINLMLVCISMILLIIHRSTQWLVGLAILFAFSVGITAPIISNNFGPLQSGYAILARTLSLPWLLVLVQRFPKGYNPSESRTLAAEKTNDHRVVDIKPTLIDLLLQINLETTRTEKLPAIVRALSLGTIADICYLAQCNRESDTITLTAGYDLIREVFLPTAAFTNADLPHITAAWSEGRVLKLSTGVSEIRDTETLAQLLKVAQVGHLLAYPLQCTEPSIEGGVVLLSPYTDKAWGVDTIHLLDNIKVTLTQVVYGKDPLETSIENLAEKSMLIQELYQTQKTLATALIEKEAALTELHNDLKQLKARYQIEKFESVQQIEALRKTIRQQRPLKSQSMAPPVSQEPAQSVTPREIQSRVEYLNAQIRHLSEERDALKIALARAQAQIKHLQTQAGQTGPTQLSMDQQIITLDSVAANVQLKMASILQQKTLTLDLVNPDGRQMIKTDPELLQTVLEGLLENAAHASPHRDTIELTQTLSMETGMLIAEVTDHGNGLTAEEQTALFNARQESLPGIGSLSAIRRAIQAIRVLNGKIWLRSEKNQFTTFRIQLPVRIID